MTSPLMVSHCQANGPWASKCSRKSRNLVAGFQFGFGAVVYVMSTRNYTYIYIFMKLHISGPFRSPTLDISPKFFKILIFSKFLSWKPRHSGIYCGHLLRCHGTAVADSHAVAAADAAGGGP